MDEQIAGGGATLPPGLSEEDTTEAEVALLEGNTVSAQELASWPWYEARLAVYVRSGKPTDTFGEGGEELAHVRASTQAPSFPQAVARLDADLATGWTRMMAHADLVDQNPSPEVVPAPRRVPLVVEVRLVVVLLVTLLVVLQSLALVFT